MATQSEALLTAVNGALKCSGTVFSTETNQSSRKNFSLLFGEGFWLPQIIFRSRGGYMSRKLTYEELEQRVQELEASKTLREQKLVGELIESIQAGVVVHGKDGTVIKSNSTAQKMLGLTHKQMLGNELINPAWTFLREDGSPMPVEEYPVSRVFRRKKLSTT